MTRAKKQKAPPPVKYSEQPAKPREFEVGLSRRVRDDRDELEAFALYPYGETDTRPLMIARERTHAEQLAEDLDAELRPVLVLLTEPRERFTLRAKLADLEADAAAHEAELQDASVERSNLERELEDRETKIRELESKVDRLRTVRMELQFLLENKGVDEDQVRAHLAKHGVDGDEE